MKKYWRFRNFPVIIAAEDELGALNTLQNLAAHAADTIKENLKSDPTNKAVEKTYEELFAETFIYDKDSKTMRNTKDDPVESDARLKKDKFTATVVDIVNKTSKKFVN